jgi:hypothetical protein
VRPGTSQAIPDSSVGGRTRPLAATGERGRPCSAMARSGAVNCSPDTVQPHWSSAASGVDGTTLAHPGRACEPDHARVASASPGHVTCVGLLRFCLVEVFSSKVFNEVISGKLYASSFIFPTGFF